MESLSKIIARNYVSGIGAQFVLRILSWLFQIYVIRNLGAEVFGKYSQVLAFIAIFSILGDLGISNYASREIAQDHSKKDELYWNVRAIRFLLTFVVVIVATGSAWILNRPMDIVIGVFIASCELFLYIFMGSVEFLLNGYERVDIVSGLVIVSRVLFLITGMLVMVNNIGYLGLVMATWPGVLLYAILGEWIIRKRLNIRMPFQITPKTWSGLLLAGYSLRVNNIHQYAVFSS